MARRVASDGLLFLASTLYLDAHLPAATACNVALGGWRADSVTTAEVIRVGIYKRLGAALRPAASDQPVLRNGVRTQRAACPCAVAA